MIHKAKKSLGQNFLKSKPALNAMCSSGEINNEDIIVEIGPGKGVLTEKLLEKSKKVIAVEKDSELINFLKDKFTNSNNLELIEDDILNFNPGNLKYKVIANIPYNITGLILRKFLTEKNQPEKMVILVQKEVAERIVARDGKESILSISVKAYGEPKYVMKVEKRFFSPQPKVDSAIIAINNISRKNFKNLDQENKFFEILKTGFAHKRKMLLSNLGNSKFTKIFEELGIDKKVRAENISVEQWLKITTRSVI